MTNYKKIIKCLDCNSTVVVKSGKEKRCVDCQKKYETKYRKDYYSNKLKGNIEHLCRARISYKKWSKNNPDKVKEARRKYRENNLELCRKRTRENQLKLNDKKRFGGLRSQVLERDKHKCRLCGKDISGKNMAVIHHKDENKSNNTMRNLISLCKTCHPKIHYSLKEHQFTSQQLKKLWEKRGIKFFNR